MRIPFDLHWSWQHQGPEDDEAFRALQPGAIWIINPDAEIVRRARAACPNALIGLRDQAQGEQHDFMHSDPTGCAEAHMRDWLEHIPKWAPGVSLPQLFITGINEPLIDTLEREQHACAYYTRLTDLGTEHGIAVAAGSFGNGWPGNDDTPTQHDTPAHWDRPHFRALIDAIRAGRKAGVPHFLNVHEYYGDPNGPQSLWGWHCGRILQFLHWMETWGINPAEVPIRLGELGFDRLAVDPHMTKEESRGWAAGWMPAERYVEHLSWLYQQYGYHDSILGAGVFGWDNQGKEWATFSIRPIAAQIVAMVQQLRRQLGSPSFSQPLPHISWPASPAPPPVPQPEPEPTPMPTNIWPALIWPVAGGVGVVTQEFGERPEYYAKLGSPGGHNGRDISVVGYDASHPPALVATIPGECWPYADTNPAGQMQGYGWVVEVWYPSIAHPIVKTIQAHMIGEPVVRRGQLVKVGDLLGYMGSSGNSTGPHVHYSIKPKLHGARNPMFLDWIDPRSFMPR